TSLLRNGARTTCATGATSWSASCGPTSTGRSACASGSRPPCASLPPEPAKGVPSPCGVPPSPSTTGTPHARAVVRHVCRTSSHGGRYELLPAVVRISVRRMAPMTTTRAAWAHGVATVTTDGTLLDTWFPEPALGAAPEVTQVPEELLALADEDTARGVRCEVVTVGIDLDAAPEGVADGYLRLHLLSHRLVRPNSINLDGLFGQLTNVVWTNHGPCAVEGFEATRARLRARGPVVVTSIDKFPRMTDYVIPSGVRIGDADRVRLGAHLASGTTVMHEGFVNFNAGTLGSSMIEGRVSQGVIVGDGSDIGGGAS